MARGLHELPMRNDPQVPESSKVKKTFGPDGKKLIGYKINPQDDRIDLRDVAAQDSNHLMRRMFNLEKNFMSIPAKELAGQTEESETKSDASSQAAPEDYLDVNN